MALRNVFACLVHESHECVVDLVRNLRHLDPDSAIILYNGGSQGSLLAQGFPFERYGALLHPHPRRTHWGKLHLFALDCMRFAIENVEFDAITIVDSDQLAARPGYSRFIGPALTGRVGMLGNSPSVQGPGSAIGPAVAAMKEVDLWRPLLRRFHGGERKFPHWSFWPSTVFTREAAGVLVRFFDEDRQLEQILSVSEIWATEEVILPTCTALLGFEIGQNPCSYDFVQYRVAYGVAQIEQAMERADCYWIHPVPRDYDNPIRQTVRKRWNQYRSPQREAAGSKDAPELVLSLPVLERMRKIEGWLTDEEGDLLLAAASRALADLPAAGAIVEIGSYCGRSTVVLGAAAKALGGAKVWAVDPHDGKVGALDQGLQYTPPTLAKFQHNIAEAGLKDVVETVTQCSYQVEWSRPIAMLFIDGLHDYANVARDFYHFERWLAPGAYVAFHDYADYYPGVKTFVDELLATGCYQRVRLAWSLMVVRRLSQDPQEASPRAIEVVDAPLVSCVLPTYNRRRFLPQSIRYFQRQDYTNRELIVIDDGSDCVQDLIPDDPKIRYMRLDSRLTLGAKLNLGCELARGPVIAHWDDDDWLAGWRLSYQVRALLRPESPPLCGLSRLMFFEPATGKAWEYEYPPSDRPWICGGTFCYRKEFWREHPHADMTEGVDTVLTWSLRPEQVLPLPDNQFCINTVHGANCSRKRTETTGWRPLPFEAIRQVMREDYTFYLSDAWK